MRNVARSILAAITLVIVCPMAEAQQIDTQDSALDRVAFQDVAPSVAAGIGTANNVVQNGIQLEKNGQWAEALTLYQQAVKEFPADKELKKRQTIARIHYDLDRRYSDSSFLKSISSTNDTTALNVYAEVLLKIQSYYVDQPQWVGLASYGLTNMEIAVYSPKFMQKNSPNATRGQAADAFRKVKTQISTKPIRTRHDVYVVAGIVAKTLKAELGIPIQSTIFEFTSGAIAALDPYSAFMSTNQYSETMSQIEGNFVGLGIELRTHQDHLEIVNVIKGGPANMGNIIEGDRIVSVDNLVVGNIGSERAADMLRGLEGSFVTIGVSRNTNATQSVRLERKRVEIPSVEDVGIVDSKNGVGYIRLTNFQKTTARDFDSALWKLHRAGMKTLIVDVRGNPGGLLSASVEVVDRFVNSGVIVSTRGRNPLEDFTHRAQVAKTWRVPLVVLIDENSASASEIFAAAIRDHQRGTIVGRQSYGKGSVQGIFPLNVSGGGVRLTTAKFFSPQGLAISKVGVKPDVPVHMAAKPAAGVPVQTDPDLRIGIQVANRSRPSQNVSQRAVPGKSLADQNLVRSLSN